MLCRFHYHIRTNVLTLPYTDSNIIDRRSPLRKVPTETLSFHGTALSGMSFFDSRWRPIIGSSLSPGVNYRVFLHLRRSLVHSDLRLGRGLLGVSSTLGVGCGSDVGTLRDFASWMGSVRM